MSWNCFLSSFGFGFGSGLPSFSSAADTSACFVVEGEVDVEGFGGGGNGGLKVDSWV